MKSHRTDRAGEVLLRDFSEQIQSPRITVTLTAVMCTSGKRMESVAGGAIWKVEWDTGNQCADITPLFVCV